MKRILFVDDEPAVLEALRLRLRRHRKIWDMTFVTSATEALEEVGRRPFDVIVSDMIMPGMDGVQMLHRVRAEHPDIIRIMLTGSTEPEVANRALEVAHQLLSKPCDGDQLRHKIEHCVGLRDLVDHDGLRALVGRIKQLPSVPSVYARLSQALDDDRADSRTISHVLSEDPSMCAKVLQVVNSAFFRLQRRIADIESAVSYLGVDTVRCLTLTVGVFDDHAHLPPGFDHDGLRAHSLRAATIARAIAEPPIDRGDAFVAAMLHDIGLLLMAASLPAEWRNVYGEGVPDELVATEVAAWGASHAAIGAYLLGAWGLPHEIVQAVAHHHDPGLGDLSLSHITHAADALAREIAGERPRWSLELMAAWPERIAAWRQRAREAIGTGLEDVA